MKNQYKNILADSVEKVYTISVKLKPEDPASLFARTPSEENNLFILKIALKSYKF